jgi:hypothetical protein
MVLGGAGPWRSVAACQARRISRLVFAVSGLTRTGEAG